MTEDTTTPVEQEAQAPQGQPEEPVQDGAENQSNDTAPQEPQADNSEAQSESQSQDDLKEWAEKKGLSLDEPEKILKSYREAEKALHQKGMEASKLRNSVNEKVEEANQLNPASNEIEDLRRQLEADRLDRKVAEFYIQNPDASKYDAQMAELVQQKPWLANDLNDLYQLAKAQGMNDVVEQARAQERQRLAQQSQTTTANTNARSVSANSKPITRSAVAAMSQAEYRERLPEINQTLKDNGGVLPD